MEIRIYNTFEDEYLSKRWGEIVRDNNYYVQNSYNWCSIWWKHFHSNKNRELYIITVFHKGEIVGIAPMLIEKRFGFREMRFIGAGHTDFHQLLVEGDFYESSAEVILRHFGKFREWDIVYLDEVNDEDRLYKYLVGREDIKVKYKIGCPIVDIDELNWDEYIKNIKSKNLRKDYQRKSHKLERETALELMVIDQEEGLRLYIEELFGLHIERWAHEGEISAFNHEDMKSFIKDVFLSLIKDGKARLYILKDGENVISYRLGFVQNGVFYDWITSFDKNYIKYSPGKIITGYVIKHLIEDNYKVFHFMRGDYDYKKGWMHKDREHISGNYLFIFAKSNARGRVLERYYLVWRDKIKAKFGRIVSNSHFKSLFRLKKQ